MAAQQIEKRIPFRQVMKKSIERVMTNKEAKGIRMEMSGRLNGIEIARREWLGQGQMPRNTIRADIDYAQAEAQCTYGKIGIKIWIYKGEKFDN
jgi:small subunit ribosomal protein S3